MIQPAGMNEEDTERNDRAEPASVQAAPPLALEATSVSQLLLPLVVHRLDPAHVPASRLTSVITTVVLAAFGGTGCVIFWFVADDIALAWKVSVCSALFLLVTVGGVFGYVWPALELTRTRWRIGLEGMEIKRGVLWRHVVTVPSSRIQHTDVTQGPIQRRFGLATLVIHTAGSHDYQINLDGIAHGVAFGIRDYLLQARESEHGDGA